jgi:hypothetical protein
MLPRRCAGEGLPAAEYWMAPSPWPEGPDVIVSHGASLVAAHGHSRAADTLTVPVPPLAAMDEPPVKLIAQRVPDGLITVLVDEPQPTAINAIVRVITVPDTQRDTYLPTTAARDARARPEFSLDRIDMDNGSPRTDEPSHRHCWAVARRYA